MREKLKEKLNVDFKKYTILGACNPLYAYKALQIEDKIGTMLPCNVVVQELSEKQTEVAAVNPIASMMAIQKPLLNNIADEITKKLKAYDFANCAREVLLRILNVVSLISLNTFLIWQVDSSLQNSHGRYVLSDTQYINAIVPSKWLTTSARFTSSGFFNRK
jgi:hypothetical protein